MTDINEIKPVLLAEEHEYDQGKNGNAYWKQAVKNPMSPL